MTTYSSRFTPLLFAEGGFQSEPLAIGAGAVRLSTLLVLPPFVNSAWIQVPAGETLLYRMDGDLTGTDWLTLPSLWYLPLTNRKELEQMVVRSGAGTTTVNVQFFRGSVGPIPPAPEGPDSGGIIPPPPPGLSGVITTNTIHVMKVDGIYGGNDATGTRNRLDLPFLTLAAAEAVALPGDTIHIWAGTYVVANAGVDGVTYYRHGCILEDNGSDYMFYNAAGASYNIAGEGEILVQNGGLGAILMDQPGYTVNCFGSIYGSNHTDILVTQGGGGGCTLNVYGDITSEVNGALLSDGLCFVSGDVESGPNFNAAHCTDGSQTVGGSATAGGTGIAALAEGGNQTIKGPVTAEEDAAICDDATQNIYGPITSFSSIAAQTINATSVQRIYAPVHSDGLYGARCVNGNQFVSGNITCAGGRAAQCDAGVQFITGNLNALVDYCACTNGSSAVQYIYGDVTCESSWAAVCLTGTQKVWGDCTCTNATFGVGADCITGDQEVFGNVYHTGVGFGASSIFRQRIHGNITSNTLACRPGVGATVKVGGNITSGENIGLYVVGGTIHVDGIVSGKDNMPAVRMDAGATCILGEGAMVPGGTSEAVEMVGDANLTLLSTAYLTSAGGAPSIDGAGTGSTIRSYNAYCNVAEAVGFTITGTLNPLP